MCAYCKMAISERRYAAEAVDSEGNVYKFDNAACLTRFVTERQLRSRMAAYYVADYETRSWLDARHAVYAKSPAIPSPMASGLAAFRDTSQAQSFAAGFRGQTIAFEDLWTSIR